MSSHRIRRGALALLLCLLALAGGGWWALAAALPDTFYTTGSAQALRIASLPWVSVRQTQAEVEQAGRTGADKSQNVTLALFGAVPLKTVRAVTVQERSVQVCGTLFGVKMFSDGALVVAFSDQYTAPWHRKPRQGGRPETGGPDRFGRRARRAQQ